VAQAGVGDHGQARRQRRGQGLDRGHERRRLAGRPGMRPEVQRHPGGSRGLQRLDLPADGPVRGPALLHQGGAGINTVHLSYVREGTGHALIGAREWIPAEHLKNPAKSAVMGGVRVPDDQDA
jgi:hypothetical protein